MTQRGRKSAADRAVMRLAPAVTPRRAEPPPDLPTAAAELWRAVVDSLPASHFTPADLPLLEGFCRCAANIQTLDAMLDAEGLVVDGKRHPAAGLRDAEAKSMRAFAEKLRLCPSARLRSDSAKLPQPGARPWER